MKLINPTDRQLEAAFAEHILGYQYWIFETDRAQRLFWEPSVHRDRLANEGWIRIETPADLGDVYVPETIDGEYGSIDHLMHILDSHLANLHFERGDDKRWFVLVWTDETMLAEGDHSGESDSLARAIVIAMLRFAGVEIVLDGETKS